MPYETLGELPESAWNLGYDSPGNRLVIGEAMDTLATRLEKGDSFPVALKKAMIQLGRDAVKYEVPDGHKLKIQARWEEMKESKHLAAEAGRGFAPWMFFKSAGLLKDSAVTTGEILGGFGMLGHFATKIDQAFKTASMERRVDSLARSMPGKYEANRLEIFENEETVSRLARDAADANVSYHDLPRLSKWLGPTGVAPFFNYMASAGKKMLAFPTQRPLAYQMYSEGMRLHKEGLFGREDPDREEKTNRAMWRVMQGIPNEVWAMIPALFSGERTTGRLADNTRISGKSPEGKVMRFTYGSPFQQELLRAMFNLQDEKRIEHIYKGGAIAMQPLAGPAGILYEATGTKGPYGEDLVGYTAGETAYKKAGFVLKGNLPTYVHWIFDAKARAEQPENNGVDPRTKMTLGEINASAAGIPIRGALWIRNKAVRLRDSYDKHISAIEKSDDTPEGKEEDKKILTENYWRMQIPWLRGAF